MINMDDIDTVARAIGLLARSKNKGNNPDCNYDLQKFFSVYKGRVIGINDDSELWAFMCEAFGDGYNEWESIT